ncbi:MAG: DNA gyrase subunit A [Planctomycetes bacterium]|nr:DNA gyrase subunit A [Planctomycetota bacterium]MBL7044890.1 DNA gyrase subunit A [Pirellulaceae bacterium]
MSNDSDLPADPSAPQEPEINGDGDGTSVIDHPIEDELKESYLTYAMSVIVSRALPDVRDGLKPSQRRILVAMDDLNLAPSGSTSKCAGIVGETMKRYHPHSDAAIYPTLVRLAQEWNTRYLLVGKQGNFGSIAGLPPAQMRYTEARLSPISVLMLQDYKMDTVDFVPNYDEKYTEPSVLPGLFPNLLVNGSTGIAVGMATSIPPHNLREVCDALIRVIDDPDISIDELLEIIQGPDFPTGGMICGRAGIRQGYHTGRSNVVVRGRAKIEERSRGRHRIVITEIPFQQFRDRIVEKIGALVNGERIKGITGVTDLSDLNEPVRIVVDVKRDSDPEVVLNQLYQFSPLQDTFSIILLALVDGKPRLCSIKQFMEEYIRHRVTVIRRRTQFLLAKARRRKHTVEGLLLALANIDEIIRIIRNSQTQAEAKVGLMGVECPAAMMAQALGGDGFQQFQQERGVADAYALTAVQADAILRMTLGQLVNLEQERLGDEHRKLLEEIIELLRILSDEQNILSIIKDNLKEIRKKYGDERRTEITGEEIGNIDLEDLIAEETMVVSISHRGYIKRTPATAYRAQRRGGKGIRGAQTEEEDPIEHLFVASTHAFLLFFSSRGKVYWQKVYDLPQMARERKGRAIVNLLNLEKDEKIADCRQVRDFNLPGHFLMMATRKGLVKKTALEAYSRPKRGGIIAIKLREDDELVDVVVTKPGDEVVLATADGMAIRFSEADARSMGRNTSGVKGIRLKGDDELVGMVVADPDATLLTACENGYGKRTNFGPNTVGVDNGVQEDGVQGDGAQEESTEEETVSGTRYRTQRRGGMGLRDIKTTARNGKVIGVTRVDDDDELLMMTARGKIQRIAAREISVIGRNTQGVRIMGLDEGDSLAAAKRLPKEEEGENGNGAAEGTEEASAEKPENPTEGQ